MAKGLCKIAHFFCLSGSHGAIDKSSGLERQQDARKAERRW